MQTETFAIQESERAGARFAEWALWIIVAMVVAWDYFGDSDSRYIIYALPLLLVAVHLVLYSFRPRLDGGGLMALGLYTVAVIASLAVNPGLDIYAQRNLLIIFGYFVILSLYLRAPAWTADVVLLGIIAGLAIEISRAGIVLNFEVFSSQGMIESSLAFPLGLVLIYYLNERQWGRALIAAIVLVVGSKRIAMAGVLAAVALDVLSYRLSPVARRRLFFAAVVLCIAAALFSEQVFKELGALANIDSNEVSLGRYSFASELWARFSPTGLRHWLFGLGPGSADAWLVHQGILLNPHNDWLKILFEYGIFGLVLLLAAFAALFPRTRFGNKLFLYTAVLMITDNTLIYLYHFAVVFLISRIVPPPAGRAVAQQATSLGHQVV
jgi:O-antigen ligase